MKYFTIIMFNGTVQHVEELIYGKILKAISEGVETFMVNEKFYSRKSISNTMSFIEWQKSEEQKLLQKGKELYICDFGQFHSSHEKCHCAAEGALPLTEEAVKLTQSPILTLAPVPVLKDGKVIETL